MTKQNTNWINFADVKDKTDFETVLDFYAIAYTGNNEQKTISCPFHEEKTPSCKVNTAKKVFNCFGCGAGGNVLDFIVLKENGNTKDTSDFRNGAIKAIEIMGGQTPNNQNSPSDAPQSHNASSDSKDIPTSKKIENSASDEVKINEVLKFNLQPNPNHPSLAEHNLSKSQVTTFGLGFQNKGMMKNRIVFPIHNENNELIAYAGRWAEKEVPEDEMRYKLPQKFYKSLVLYNLNRVTEKWPDLKHIIIVEGFWSVIRLHTAGVPTVASMGTSISSEQIALLKKIGIEKITLIFDGDKAGRLGIENTLPTLTQDFFVRTISLDEGIKPDTMDEKIITSLLA